MTTKQHKEKVDKAKDEIEFLFKPSRDRNKKTLYRDEGNMDFNSEENMGKRLKIKEDYYLKEAINTVSKKTRF